jgi:hypothetical protein
LLEAEKEVQVSDNQIRRQQQQPNGNGVEVGVDEAARDQLIQWLLEVLRFAWNEVKLLGFYRYVKWSRPILLFFP